MAKKCCKSNPPCKDCPRLAKAKKSKKKGKKKVLLLEIRDCG